MSIWCLLFPLANITSLKVYNTNFAVVPVSPDPVIIWQCINSAFKLSPMYPNSKRPSFKYNQDKIIITSTLSLRDTLLLYQFHFSTVDYFSMSLNLISSSITEPNLSLLPQLWPWEPKFSIHVSCGFCYSLAFRELFIFALFSGMIKG